MGDNLTLEKELNNVQHDLQLNEVEVEVEVDWKETSLKNQKAIELPVQPATFIVAKRMSDLILSTIGLLFLMPLFLLIALLIKLENPKGKIFFSQKRIGKNGRPFKMYKFRSMNENAEKELLNLVSLNEIEGHMFKMKNDPRVTNVGKFIRKTSLDELPQLLNVIKGDMSLVGPRPPLEREVINYSSYHMQRLQIIPGCTGLWQVSDRNETDFEGMVELDLIYAQKNSILFDYVIILKTIKTIFIGSGY